MKVAVRGWYNHGNCGDESYKIAFPFLFPEHEFTFFDESPIGDISDFDLLVLGGGDIINETFLKGIDKIDIPKQSISVGLTNGSKLDSLHLFNRVVVRDNESYNLIKNIHKGVQFCPDITFCLQGNSSGGLETLKEKFGEVRHTLLDKIIVVSLNDYLSFNTDNSLVRDKDIFHYFVRELANIIEDTEASFVFLPFSTASPWDDRHINGWVSDHCKKSYWRNICIHDRLSPQETLNIISAANAVISTRLHSSIFSTISATPFVDITHHDKNKNFLKTISKEDWSVPFWKLDFNKVRFLLTEFLENKKENGYDLARYTQIARTKLNELRLPG